MIYIYIDKFSGLPGVFVIKRLIYVEFGVLWKGKEKEKKNGNWKYRRPKWATAHFEASVTIEKIYHDRVPCTLRCDRAPWTLRRDRVPWTLRRDKVP